jgi:hypothetical protein
MVSVKDEERQSRILDFWFGDLEKGEGIDA